MASGEEADSTGASSEDAKDWDLAVALLQELLAKSRDGSVSTRALRKELRQRGVSEVAVRELAERLKSVQSEALDSGQPSRWHHMGHRFYTKDAFDKEQQSQKNLAQRVADEEVAGEAPDEEAEQEPEAPPREQKKRRAEERRLGAYVATLLQEIYDSDEARSTYVFDVHSERAGSDFENVDLLAVHWRSDAIVELVSVEVKLRFSPRLVQQANNYCRFSDRVWVAVPVNATLAKDAASELRAADPGLFDYVVELGLGILACHKGRGGAYDVFPIHWPSRCSPDPLEKSRFIGRYRAQFEEAEVVASEPKSYPRF